MRIGLIGCGWIAETHLASLSALGEQVACVCDPDPERLAWAAGATGAEAFGDWESLLERGRARGRARADAAAPAPRGHGRGARARPPGLPREARRARSRRRAGDRRGGRAHRRRVRDRLPVARDRLAAAACATLFAERTLGLLAARMFGATAGRTWFTDQAAGGGQVLERASHGIDLDPGDRRARRCASRRPARTCRWPAPTARRAARSTTCSRSRSSSSAARVATVQVVWQRDDLPRTYELDVIGDGARVECVLDPEFRATGLADGAAVDLRDAGAPERARPRALPRRRARGRARPRSPARPRRPRPRSRRRWPASRRCRAAGASACDAPAVSRVDRYEARR